MAAAPALAADLAMSLDPVRLSQAAGIDPDAWQVPSMASQGQAPSGQPDLTLAERQAWGDLVDEMRTRVRGTRGQQKAEATRTKLQTALEVKAAATGGP